MTGRASKGAKEGEVGRQGESGGVVSSDIIEAGEENAAMGSDSGVRRNSGPEDTMEEEPEERLGAGMGEADLVQGRERRDLSSSSAVRSRSALESSGNLPKAALISGGTSSETYISI